MNWLKRFWKRLWCSHTFKYSRAVYGDEINLIGRRYEYTCQLCGKTYFTDIRP